MELTPMQLYWIIKLDTFCGLFTGFAVIFGILTIVCITGAIITFCDGDEKYSRIWKKFVKYIASFFIIFLSIAVFLPTTKEMAAIMILPKIINNEKVQEIPQRLLDLGLEWLNELKPVKQTIEQAK